MQNSERRIQNDERAGRVRIFDFLFLILDWGMRDWGISGLVFGGG